MDFDSQACRLDALAGAEAITAHPCLIDDDRGSFGVTTSKCCHHAAASLVPVDVRAAQLTKSRPDASVPSRRPHQPRPLRASPGRLKLCECRPTPRWVAPAWSRTGTCSTNLARSRAYTISTSARDQQTSISTVAIGQTRASTESRHARTRSLNLPLALGHNGKGKNGVHA